MSPADLLSPPRHADEEDLVVVASNTDVATTRRAATLEFVLDPPRLFLTLAACIVVLAGLSAIAHLFLSAVPEDQMRAVREVALRFDMDRENSLPEWFSSTMLVACGLLLVSIGRRWKEAGRPFVWHWLVLGAAFFYLSIDESVALHEILMVPLRRRLGASGIFYFSWVIVALPLIAILFVAYVKFLRHLPRVTMWLFLLSGALYVGGALGMEMVGGALAEAEGFYTLRYTVVMMTEETCEMLGAALFLCTLISVRQTAPSPERIASRGAALRYGWTDPG